MRRNYCEKKADSALKMESSSLPVSTRLYYPLPLHTERTVCARRCVSPSLSKASFQSIVSNSEGF